MPCLLCVNPTPHPLPHYPGRAGACGPLQLGLSASAAAAEVAERLATRAETDRRLDDAVAAQGLAIRAWQRAGNKAAAFQAAARHDALEAARVTGL